MLTLLYSMLEGATITVSQQAMAWITLAVDVISAAYLIYKMIKSRKMSAEDIIKLIKKNLKGNDLNMISHEIVTELMNDKDKKED